MMRGRARITQAQPTLQQRGRGFAFRQHGRDGLFQHGVGLPEQGAPAQPLLPGRVGLRRLVARARRSDIAPEIDDGAYLFLFYQAALDALRPGCVAGEVEHVAIAEQGFSADSIQDDAGIDAGSDGEGHAGGEVGLDEAGKDVDARALGGDDEMHADGAGHLGQACEGAFQFPRGGRA